MEESVFISERTGKLKRLPNTVFKHFSPAKLPFEITYTPQLAKQLANATLSLGNLSEAGNRLENPHLLIRPYMRKEAVLSSKMEGTRTTLSDVFVAEVSKYSEPRETHKEVLNYIESLEYGLNAIEDVKISQELLRKLHLILLQNVRGEDKDPGEYKVVPNWLGPEGADMFQARFIPAAPGEVEELMQDIITYLNADDETHPLIKIALAHYQFETIHPFRDGNGRIGRLLIILYLCQKKVISQPLLYVSEYLERHNEQYKTFLFNASAKGEIEQWISFFLKAVDQQAKDALQKAKELEQYRDETKQMLMSKYTSSTVLQVFDLLFLSPVVTIKTIQSQVPNCGYTKAKYNLDLLIEEKILQLAPGRHGRKMWAAVKIIDLLRA